MLTPTKIETVNGTVEGYETPFGVIALVDPTWIAVDNGTDGYQREYDDSWAARIAEVWQDSKARPVNCRLRGRELWCTNGQHTAAAARKAERPFIMAVINNGTPSRQKEAVEFTDFQTRVKTMHPYDKYKAALVAKVADALDLKAVAAALNLRVSRKKSSPDDGLSLTSITELRRIASESGQDGLREVLEACLLWNVSDPARFRFEVLRAVAKARKTKNISTVKKSIQTRNPSANGLFQTALAESRGSGYRGIDWMADELLSMPH